MTTTPTNPLRLSFCKIIPRTENITEVIIDNDVEVNDEMVDEYHAWLDAHHDGDFAILVNKTNRYTYTFNAQLRLGKIEKMKLAAFLVRDSAGETAVKAMMGIKSRRQMPNNIFYDHAEALNWLQQNIYLINPPETDPA